MHTSSIAYHEGELRVALDARHPHRVVPDPGDARSILDIGCGAGQTIVALGAGGRTVGIDVDPAAQGERLPFADGAFDYVYSRVALPYMDIPSALAEMARVLRVGGRLWLALHPIDIPAEQFRRGNLKGKVYALYTMTNGAWFHVTGRTLRLPGGICESIQTRRGMGLALTRAGFHHVGFHRTAVHFTVTAER